ncbi:MerR family transcriptional regulator [Nonomuraea sp. NPDC050451]|uniref:MerR family transcriptional regulator n=1 Tax=Nonomuraea sp. NPDC050451 TaxID=3364364 RepID=UPI0037A5864F
MFTNGLTIGQLAAHAGVTVRTVRHYHQLGLLPEPERDVSGYRRYQAQAVVDLIRIKTLADTGVPLARIDQLLQAGEEQFAAAVDEIDRAVAARIKELRRHRARLATLVAGDRLFLPPEVIEILQRQRALGFSERLILVERDSWIMVAALAPQSIPQWVATKNAALDDPEFVQLYLACDQAMDWAPNDPRLGELADAIVAWNARHPRDNDLAESTAALLSSNTVESSPVWARLQQLVAARMA